MCQDGACGHFTDANGDDIKEGTPEYAAAKAAADAAPKQEKQNVMQIEDGWKHFREGLTKSERKDHGLSPEQVEKSYAAMKQAYFAGVAGGVTALYGEVEDNHVSPIVAALTIVGKAAELGTVGGTTDGFGERIKQAVEEAKTITGIIDGIKSLRGGGKADGVEIHEVMPGVMAIKVDPSTAMGASLMAFMADAKI